MPAEISDSRVTQRKQETRREIGTLPCVVISLDFELRWGMYDKLGFDLDAYRAELEGVQDVVPALLKLLSARRLRATWASVGALACRDWHEYFRRAPQPPNYLNPRFRFGPRYAELDPEGDLHFAPDLLKAIQETPGQELGTHTFSHLCMREPGVTAEDARADLNAVGTLWKERFGFLPRSLVFPRNQIAFLEVVRSSFVRIWRGNPVAWYYDRTEGSAHNPLSRALVLLDSLHPWARRASRLEGDMTRASLFLRVDLPRAGWALHLARIRNELDRLGPGEIFHLYWHPHNLGVEMDSRLGRIEEVLDGMAERCQRKSAVSRFMGELVA